MLTDFDDTVTLGNVGANLRQRFARTDLSGIEAEYASGKISVEENNRRQFALISLDEPKLAAYLKDRAVLRDGFSEFVDYCRIAGVRLVITNSGVDPYVDTIPRDNNNPTVERHPGTGRITGYGGIDITYFGPHGESVQS